MPSDILLSLIHIYRIHRAKLTYEEIEEELKTISKTGLQDILILTGEEKKQSSVEYIGCLLYTSRCV